MLKRTRVTDGVKNTKYGKLLDTHFKSSMAPHYLESEVAIALLKFVEFLELTVGTEEQEFAANFAAWMGDQPIPKDPSLARWLHLYSKELAKVNTSEPEEDVVWSAYELNYQYLTNLQNALKWEPEFMERVTYFSVKSNLFWPSFSLWLRSDYRKDFRDQSAMGWLRQYIEEGNL